MHAELGLISTVAVGFGLALLFGFLAVKAKLPAIVGYIVAGIVMGPATPGFVADIGLANQLAEIGVMLLMFGVGLHFSIEDLAAVRRIAVPGAIAQIAGATALGAAVAWWWGWGLAAGLVFGLSLSVASTVVLLRALESRGSLDTLNGRIAVGWLVVEDIVTVLVLVLLPAIAGKGGPGAHAVAGSLWVAFLATLAQVGVFVVVMYFGGRRLFPWLLWQVARTGSRELFTLCVIAAAVGVAYASSEIFGVSFALGAFFAGMMLRESALSHRAAEESLPLRDAFSVLFFVSVGMLFDPGVLIEHPGHVLATTAIVMVGKSVVAFLIVIAFRYTMGTAFTVSASLAQIGEFSFILAGMGVALGLMPQEGSDLVLAAAIVSIAANHLVFASIDPIQRWIRRHPGIANPLDRPLDPLKALPIEVGEAELTGHAVLVGYGRVGKRVGEALAEQGIRFVVAEQNREAVEKLRARGVHAVTGDASDPVVLAQTHVMRARLMIVATPDAFRTRKMVETARILNPKIDIVVRTHSDEEAEILRRENAGRVFFGEEELANGMIRHVLDSLGARAAG